MSNNYLSELQNGLTPNDRLKQIVSHSMCIGCGICESIAGSQSIQMQVVDNGFERPIIKNDLSHEIMDKIVSVCPGTQVEGLPDELFHDVKIDPIWGAIQELYLSYSAEPEIRHLSATGGLLTGLALYLLESNTVDFILHASASKDNPSFGEAWISRTRDDVINAAGSRYGPTATLKNIVNTLETAQSNNQSFAFIGTPCDVNALRNYAKIDERVNKFCHYMLTMVCGGFMAPAGLNTFLESKGVDVSKISSIRYRGYGCPGPTTIKTTDGEVTTISYLDFWGEDDSNWHLPARCKVCPDGIGDAADIAAADTWDGGSPNATTMHDDLGSNAAIVRSQRGLQLMERAISAGYLIKGDKLTIKDMNNFQPHQVSKKLSVWSRFQGLKDANQIVPETNRLRIESLSNLNSHSENDRQRNGTRERAEKGAFTE